MLDVQRLRLLRELSYRGTIAQVAQALGYSHSSVSQQLSLLEREAGTRLLERVGRRVRLTAAAELLVLHAGAVLTCLEEAEAALAELAAGGAGRLRIAMFDSAAHTLLTPMLTTLAQTTPALDVTVQVLEHEESLPRLLAHDLDLVLIEEYPGLPLAKDPDVHRVRLGADPIRLVAPARREFGRGGLAALAEAPWTLEPPGTAARTWAESVCRRAGFEPRVRFESTDLAVHLRLANEGQAAALLPELAAVGTSRQVRIEQLPRNPVRHLDTAVRMGSRRHPHVLAARAALAEAMRTVTPASS